MIRTTLLILAFAAPVHAQSAESVLVCPMLGNLAHAIMVNRQNGIAMSEHVAKVLPKDEPARSLVMAVITAAYDAPRFSTPGNQRRAAEDFRNDMEAQCYRDMNKSN